MGGGELWAHLGEEQSRQRISMCKGPEAAMCLLSSRNSQGVMVYYGWWGASEGQEWG